MCYILTSGLSKLFPVCSLFYLDHDCSVKHKEIKKFSFSNSTIFRLPVETKENNITHTLSVQKRFLITATMYDSIHQTFPMVKIRKKNG